MRLATSVQTPDDLQSLIKSRFQEFNRRSSPSTGRRYPNDLRELVQRGIAAGIRPGELKRLTGMSQSAIRSALSKAKPEKPRRLEVVGLPPIQQASSSLIIRLPSGISIELPDASMLTSVLVAAQNSLEVNHAASR
jgi:hypothetical protein